MKDDSVSSDLSRSIVPRTLASFRNSRYIIIYYKGKHQLPNYEKLRYFAPGKEALERSAKETLAARGMEQ